MNRFPGLLACLVGWVLFGYPAQAQVCPFAARYQVQAQIQFQQQLSLQFHTSQLQMHQFTFNQQQNLFRPPPILHPVFQPQSLPPVHRFAEPRLTSDVLRTSRTQTLTSLHHTMHTSYPELGIGIGHAFPFHSNETFRTHRFETSNTFHRITHLENIVREPRFTPSHTFTTQMVKPSAPHLEQKTDVQRLLHDSQQRAAQLVEKHSARIQLLVTKTVSCGQCHPQGKFQSPERLVSQPPVNLLPRPISNPPTYGVAWKPQPLPILPNVGKPALLSLEPLPLLIGKPPALPLVMNQPPTLPGFGRERPLEWVVAEELRKPKGTDAPLSSVGTVPLEPLLSRTPVLPPLEGELLQELPEAAEEKGVLAKTVVPEQVAQPPVLRPLPSNGVLVSIPPGPGDFVPSAEKPALIDLVLQPPLLPPLLDSGKPVVQN
jgi:hypothetical protein